MQKIWFIEFQGKREGPFSVNDLKRDLRITPDTLVWKEGFPNAVPIRFIPELKEVFVDEEETQDDESEVDTKKKLNRKNKQTSDELAIDWRAEPPQIYLLILIGLIVLFFVLYQLRSFLVGS